MEFRTETVRPPGLGIEFEILAGDRIIGPAIARGAWEADETRLFRAHLRPGDRVLDLGANVGWFTVQAVLAGCEVFAFEPVGGIADVLERNAARAEEVGPGRAHVFRVAAGSEPGRARIAIGAGNFGDNRVVEGGRPADMGEGEVLEIEIARVDDLVEGPFRVFKIDTQGSEWHALQGARRALERSERTALLFEFWPYALRGCESGDLLRFLAGEGFTLGKATAAPYPMSPERILRQALDPRRDPVRGGMDLYGVRGVPFHVLGPYARLKGVWRSLREP